MSVSASAGESIRVSASVNVSNIVRSVERVRVSRIVGAGVNVSVSESASVSVSISASV